MKSQAPPLEIAKPCPKSWGEMSGDSQRRFCEHCQLHVQNLSAMPPRELARFVEESGGKACIAYEVRRDGTMVTAPGRLRRIWQPLAALLAAAFPFALPACAERRTLGRISPSHDVAAGNHVSQDAPKMLLGAPPVMREKSR